MSKEIKIQIHDYDSCGCYRITESRMATIEEVRKLKEKARQSVKLDWDKLPPEFTHIVYYGELLDENQEVWFAGIYLHGEAYTDEGFCGIFNAEDIGYVGAYHRRT